MIRYFNQLFLSLCLLLAVGSSFATDSDLDTNDELLSSKPGTMFSITPLSPIHGQIPKNIRIFPVIYEVKNLTQQTRTITMAPTGAAVTLLKTLPPNASSGSKPCLNGTELRSKERCLMHLNLDGGILSSRGLRGRLNARSSSPPTVCEIDRIEDGSGNAPGPNTGGSCTSPAALDSLNNTLGSYTYTSVASPCNTSTTPKTSVAHCSLAGLTSETCGNYYAFFGSPCVWSTTYDACVAQVSNSITGSGTPSFAQTDFCDPQLLTSPNLPTCTGTELQPTSSSDETYPPCYQLNQTECGTITTPASTSYYGEISSDGQYRLGAQCVWTAPIHVTTSIPSPNTLQTQPFCGSGPACIPPS